MTVAVVIDVTGLRRLLAQHHRILRFLIVLNILMLLRILMGLLQLVRLCNLRTIVHSVDHGISPDCLPYRLRREKS
jgi:hypothetical protein